MPRDSMAIALRVQTALARGHAPTLDDQDFLRSSVAHGDQQLPLDQIARIIINHELLGADAAMNRRVAKMA